MRSYDDLMPGRTLWFVPGVSTGEQAGVPDVMRGEETQLVGLIAALGDGAHVACLPGTHSKWARIGNGQLTGFATVMTGELYAVLCQHSILGKLMNDDHAALDTDAFVQASTAAPPPAASVTTCSAPARSACSNGCRPRRCRPTSRVC